MNVVNIDTECHTADNRKRIKDGGICQISIPTGKYRRTFSQGCEVD